MLTKIRNMLKKKGQGIIEYALILAFVVGVALMVFGGDGSLKVALINSFTKTSSLIVGLFSDKTDWGHMDTSEFNSDNQGERLAVDHSSLENLANFFIGKPEEEIRLLFEKLLLYLVIRLRNFS